MAGGGFHEQALQKKLCDLNNTLPSVQTLSLWILHHRKHSQSIVKIWHQELKKERSSKRLLNLVHLCNDVVQNSRRKWPQFCAQFKEILDKSFEHVARYADPATLRSLRRVLDVWRQRAVFEAAVLDKLMYAVTSNLSSEMLSVFNNQQNADSTTPPPPTKILRASSETKSAAAILEAAAAKRRRRTDDGDGGVSFNNIYSDTPPINVAATPLSDDGEDYSPSAATPLLSAQLSTEEQLINLRDPEDIINEAPKVEELISLLRNMERPPSADVEVRQLIAQFPADIADVTKLANLATQFQAERFSQVVSEANHLLKIYNTRLDDEMTARSNILEKLRAFTRAQRCLLEKDEQSLKEYKEKLQKMVQEREDVHRHVESLPDMSKLPDFSCLPSAGDLFTLK